METIISAAITGAVTLTICLITNRAQAKATEALILHRLDQIERKQDKHNNLIERMTTGEIQEGEARKDVDVLSNRVRDLEKGDYHGHQA